MTFDTKLGNKKIINLTALSVILLIATYSIILPQLVFPPMTDVDGVSVGYATPKQALTRLNSLVKKPNSQPIILINQASDEASVNRTDLLGAYYDHQLTIDTAWDYHKSWINKIQNFWDGHFRPQHHTRVITLDRNLVLAWLNKYGKGFETIGELPRVAIKQTGKQKEIQLLKEIIDIQIDKDATFQTIVKSINSNQGNSSDKHPNPITVIATINTNQSQSTPEKTELFLNRAQQYLGESIIVKANQKIYDQKLSDEQLLSFLEYPDKINATRISELIENWKELINIEPQEPSLRYNSNTLVVSEFTPPLDGQALDIDQTTLNIISAIEKFELNRLGDHDSKNNTDDQVGAQLAIKTTKPKSELASTNEIGINELIGFGESFYAGSIPSRIHNVSLATQRVNNIIIKPGEEFSFNRTIGDISSATGYQQAYVIRNGMTELGDGGGVCQVSTTLFRAVLNAGLEVTKRLPHSYRVGYYEQNNQPGIDATVYSGEVDFRFKNDTNFPILIHGKSYPEKQYMTYSIFGTNDGRTSEIVDYKSWGYTNPPPPVYIVDTSLPAGSKRQVDWSAPGLNTSFSNIIKNSGGEIVRTDTYISKYRPWSAKYLVGE